MLQPTAVFQPMPRVVQGTGMLAQNLPAELARFNAKKILIVTDPGLISSGIPGTVRDLLASEYDVDIYSDVESDPSVESVDACAAYVKKHGFDLIVGLGGGSPIDTAKCVSVLATNPGKTSDYLGIEKVPNPGLPKIFIPTTAGTGSEVTNVAVLSLKAAQTKKGIVSRYLMADCAILDAALTVGLPGTITAATGMDALTHAIEAYVSRFAQPLTDYFALEAIRRIGKSLRTAVHYGENLAAREDVLVASLYAGLAFGSAATGMVHGLAMPLGGLYNIPHGIANAVLLPHVMRFNLVAATHRFADIAKALGEPVDGLTPRGAAERAIAAVESLSQDIGIPSYLDDLDVPRSGIDDIARDGMTNSRQVLPNPRHVTYDGLIAILGGAFRSQA
ncbi:MAG: iron-containing alcohol dehydrogenase [Pusillimonas sp.]